MAWEKRGKTSTRYLTQTTRVNGQNKREYIGTMSDPLVANLGRCDRLTKFHKQACREARAEEAEQYATIASTLDQYWGQLEPVLTAWLKLRNYRRKRKLHWVTLKRTKMKIHEPPQETRRTLPLTRDEFDVLLKRAETGGADAIDDIRDLMRSNWDVWRPFGDLAEHVKKIFLAMMVSDCIVSRESMVLRIEELANELQQANQSPMRKLMVDAVSLSWLDYHYALMVSTESSDVKGRAEQLERRLQRAQKRYFEALECLERISKLEKSRADAEQS